MISLARYSTLLAQPALRSTIAASVLGRLPIGITGLAILMLAQDASGSFGRGGAVAACYVAGLATVAPLFGRLIDRYGPRPMLLFCAFAFPATLSALSLALGAGAPLWLSFALAAASGGSFPPITVCMRTFFKQMLKDDALLATAYSLESVLIELIFILGPVLVAAFVALASPAAAVLFAAACGCAGTLLFQRASALNDWRIEPRGKASLFGPLADPGFLPLLAVIVCYASAFGLVEIGTTAYATESGRPALAGVLLGVMSIGSAAGGLVYGSRSWGLPLARQFPLMLAIMGLGIAPLALLDALWPFALWCVAAGVAMAPALIMQSMLVAKSSRPEHSTEAFTWSSTGLLAGVGLGLTLGGGLLELATSPVVFATAAALSAAAGALALLAL
ncbi:MAG TPA: MFS transporter, partial [Burkholderiales bacterium]|nr:MFS transporter [Burkholderiales bacterium]